MIGTVRASQFLNVTHGLLHHWALWGILKLPKVGRGKRKYLDDEELLIARLARELFSIWIKKADVKKITTEYRKKIKATNKYKTEPYLVLKEGKHYWCNMTELKKLISSNGKTTSTIDLAVLNDEIDTFFFDLD